MNAMAGGVGGGCKYLYFDLETIPDESRFDVSVPMPVVNQSPPFSAGTVTTLTVNQVREAIGDRLYTSRFVEAATDAERAGKNRAGVIAELRKCDPTQAEIYAEIAQADRVKLGSVTPEFLRIVSISVSNEVQEVPRVKCGQDERELLKLFWDYALTARTFVGFNCIAFDFPAIFVRSALLGVAPSLAKGAIDLRPNSRNVIDLYWSRFGPRGNTSREKPGSLKELCAIYGLDSELPYGLDSESADGEKIDGGSVWRLWKAGKLQEIAAYNCRDVELTRRLHNFYAGLFC